MRIMKKSVFLLIAITLISCSKDNEDDVFQNTTNAEIDLGYKVEKVKTNLTERITIGKTTKVISDLMYSLGVDSINVQAIKNKVKYKPIGKKDFYLNNEVFNYSDYEIILENDFIFFKIKPELKFSITQNDEIYISSPEFTGIVDGEKYEITSQIPNPLLLIFLNELIMNPDIKQERYHTQGTVGSGGGGCSYWDQVSYSEFGTTRSISTSNAEYQNKLRSLLFNLSGSTCVSFGGFDTTCIAGDHFCVTTYTFCCP